MTATLLRSMGLKTESYPFDWIFSSLAMVAHCLDDDFATLVDRTQYVSCDRDHKAQCFHTFYNAIVGPDAPTFNHHDPSLEKDYAYLNRCIARFRARLHAPGDLFVLIRQSEPDAVAQFETVAAAMRRRAPRVAMRHLAFYQDPDRAGHVDVVAIDGGCVLLTVATRTLLNWGTRFADPADDELLRLIIRTTAAQAWSDAGAAAQGDSGEASRASEASYD